MADVLQPCRVMKTMCHVLLSALLLGGCASETTPTDPSPAPAEPRTPVATGVLTTGSSSADLHVFLSNQSFAIDLVDIDLYVDDVKLVTGDFPVGSQHSNYRFDFKADADKPHVLRAVTTKGGVERSETVQVPAAGRWVVVDFWYYPEGVSYPEPTPRSFTIDAYDSEPGFD